jgi:hypothetical protein
LGVTRRALFEEVDRPHVTPSPIEDYVYAEWRIRRTYPEFQVNIDSSYYSVPSAHARPGTCCRHATVPEHTLPSHRRHAGSTPGRMSTAVGFQEEQRVADLISTTSTTATAAIFD